MFIRTNELREIRNEINRLSYEFGVLKQEYKFLAQKNRDLSEKIDGLLDYFSLEAKFVPPKSQYIKVHRKDT